MFFFFFFPFLCFGDASGWDLGMLFSNGFMWFKSSWNNRVNLFLVQCLSTDPFIV